MIVTTLYITRYTCKFPATVCSRQPYNPNRSKTLGALYVLQKNWNCAHLCAQAFAIRIAYIEFIGCNLIARFELLRSVSFYTSKVENCHRTSTANSYWGTSTPLRTSAERGITLLQNQRTCSSSAQAEAKACHTKDTCHCVADKHNMHWSWFQRDADASSSCICVQLGSDSGTQN